MARHWQYFKYVLKHKLFVLLAGLKLHVPIIILICHDWDKFLPDEWFPYARTFYAPDGSKQYKESPEFSEAWMLHQHRNKHHWQYWLNAGITPLAYTHVLVWDRGAASIIIEGQVYDWAGQISVREAMPDVFRREMLADWYGAGRALGFPDTGAWYRKNADNIKLHPDTRAWIERQLMTDEQRLIWYHDIG
jgi:hypothetical protein